MMIFVGGREELIAIATQRIGVPKEIVGSFALGNIKCFAWMEFRSRPPDASTIERAAIFLPNYEDEALFRRCVVEETTQSLGLPNDVRGSRLTRFNGMLEGGYELTGYDEIFLRVLYRPEITLGLSGDALVARARPLLEQELLRAPKPIRLLDPPQPPTRR